MLLMNMIYGIKETKALTDINTRKYHYNNSTMTIVFGN